MSRYLRVGRFYPWRWRGKGKNWAAAGRLETAPERLGPHHLMAIPYCPPKLQEHSAVGSHHGRISYSPQRLGACCVAMPVPVSKDAGAFWPAPAPVP
ncbi:hypothetical protein S7711_10907 [Stachybotrys chartarum IBT 7711]|uniref:Uncharacterized protein n=1 Tax=Stachybotrys chartarum (strain CBS 109288 / IBT 7711) TaxID=1280523 RepID=A0A084B6C4_STACB|nr:hypothetical protein S7711_10907 [Stachybotrys chartarum IBT 7711]